MHLLVSLLHCTFHTWQQCEFNSISFFEGSGSFWITSSTDSWVHEAKNYVYFVHQKQKAAYRACDCDFAKFGNRFSFSHDSLTFLVTYFILNSLLLIAASRCIFSSTLILTLLSLNKFEAVSKRALFFYNRPWFSLINK